MGQNTKTYRLTWTIDAEGTNPREAVEKIWRDVFGRHTVMPDDACVFEVTRPDGHVETIDLADDLD